MPPILQTQYQLPAYIFNNGNITGNQWSNPNNLLLTDGDVASSNPGTVASDITAGYTFSFPTNAVITGVSIMLNGYSGSPTIPPITLSPSWLDNTTGVNVYTPYTPVFTGFTPTMGQYFLGGSTYLFGTTISYDQANNFKLSLVANGNISLDSVLVSFFYYLVPTPTPPAPLSGCADCNSPIQVQDLKLAQAFESNDRYMYLESFNYADGTPVAYADLGSCGGVIDFTIDPELSFLNPADNGNFAENVRTAVWTTLPNGQVQFDFGVQTNVSTTRGIQFHTPFGALPTLRSNHNAGARVIISDSGPFLSQFLRMCQQDIVWSVPIEVQDNSVSKTTSLHLLNVLGDGYSMALTALHKIALTIHDHFVRITNNDTTPGNLNTKLTLGSSDASATIIPSILNPGGNEVKHFDIKVPAVGGGDGKVLIDGSDVTKGFLDHKFNLRSSDNSVIVTKSISAAPDEILDYDLTHAVGGSILLQQTFTKADFAPDGFGNMVATFTGIMPVGAGPAGVKYDIGTAFDAGLTMEVLDVDPAGQVIGTAVPVDAIAILFGQTAGSAIFDWSVTPNPKVIIPGAVLLTLNGSVIVTIIGSGSAGQSAIQFEDEAGGNLGTAGTVTEFEATTDLTAPAFVHGSRAGNKVKYGVNYTDPTFINSLATDPTLISAFGGGGSGGSGTPITVQDEFYTNGLNGTTTYLSAGHYETIGELNWLGGATANSIVIATLLVGEANHPGIIRLGGAGQKVWITLGAQGSAEGSTPNIVQDGMIYRSIIRPHLISTGNYMNFSIADLVDLPGTDNYIELKFDETTGDIIFNTKDATIVETTNLGIYTLNNWYDVSFKVVGASVQLWIGLNGATPTLVATHSTHIPVAGSNGNPNFYSQDTGGTGTNLDIDYFSMYDPTANAKVNQGGTGFIGTATWMGAGVQTSDGIVSSEYTLSSLATIIITDTTLGIVLAYRTTTSIPGPMTFPVKKGNTITVVLGGSSTLDNPTIFKFN